MASVPDYRTGSPVPSSGRASPINPRLRTKDDDVPSKKDKAVKRWETTVERVLATFDQSVDEWADYISFLARLLKALQIRPPNADDVPYKLLVAKRLAQCLSPALPSGVHQKTLEVYTHIFTFLGRDGLSGDLGLYLPGLGPLVSFASLSVKPVVLGIYEEYLTALSPTAIRPALKSLILSLLPALEEENSDEFDRALHILGSFKDTAGQAAQRGSVQTDAAREQYFWQCLFLASITSPTRRSGALAYLVRKLPALKAQPKKAGGSGKGAENDDQLSDAIAAVAQPDPGLLIRCFCAGLVDENVLVQRGFLDLLVERLPLCSPVLQDKAADGDLKRLIIAATTVVLRRDMSLNRRLWAWFLGPTAISDADQDPKSPLSPNPNALKSPNVFETQFSTSEYFVKHSLPMLVEGIKEQLAVGSLNAGERTRILRICLALMDRVEIGNAIIPHIFLPAVSSVQEFQTSAALKSSKAEVLRSGSAFFDSVESSVIWAEILRIVEKSLDSDRNSNGLTLVIFILSRFNVREEDMQTIHLPLAALFVISKLRSVLNKDVTEVEQSVDLITSVFRMAYSIMQQIPLRALATSGPEVSPPDSSAVFPDIASRVSKFYSKHPASNKRLFSENVLAINLLELTYSTVGLALEQYELLPRAAVEGAVSLLDIVSRKVPYCPETESLSNILQHVLTHSQKLHEDGNVPQADIALTLTMTSVLEVLNANDAAKKEIKAPYLRSVIPCLVKQAWYSLSPGQPQHHVEASRCLWRLLGLMSTDDIVESTIVDLGLSTIHDKTNEKRLEHCFRFAMFWQQSQGQSESSRNKRSQVVKVQNTITAGKLQLLGRPLFQMLDTLLDPDDDVAIFIGHWLENIPDLVVVVNVVLAHMDKATRPLSALGELNGSSADGQSNDDVDLEASIYNIRLLEKVIYFARFGLQRTLHSSGSDDAREQLLLRVQFIVDSCLSILTSRHPVLAERLHLALNLRQSCLRLLEQTLHFLSAETLARLKADLILLDELQSAIERDDRMLQIALTKAVSAALTQRSEAQKLLHDIAVQNEEADQAKGIRRSSIARDQSDAIAALEQFAVPSKVLSCILAAFSRTEGRPVLDCWFDFLKETLLLYGSNIFQIVLPLNECFCRVLRSMTQDLKDAFCPSVDADLHVNENNIIQVLNALERPLEIAHGTLHEMASQENAPKTQEQAASFFGMVSVLAPEGGKVKSSAENNRLTVLLCFKDALRVCFEIWSLDEASVPGVSEDSTRLASFKYTSLRLRNRTRRIVEHLFQARELECVETLVALWHDGMMEGDATECGKVLALLGTVETARPKLIVPALFNAIYSRTHPAALDPDKRSSLTSNVSEVTLAAFCIAYLHSLEDDAMEEIWQSCITFLKDVLTSPLNHRQILVQLLEFAVELGSKIDKTNFGEQRKMRRELGDLFIRLMSAITTIRPPGMNTEQKKETIERSSVESNEWYKDLVRIGSADLVAVLARIFPRLPETLLERDRVPSVATSISTQILGPTLKSRTFPENIDQETLDLLRVVGQVGEAGRSYKKDVSDAFNDLKFFQTSVALVADGWLPVLRQWAIGDKERLPELFGRLTAPAAAGLMFGVGASSARLEADRKTQLTLRRISTLLLAGPQDAFVVNLPEMSGKIVELLNATSASSPSSVTRAELYMLFRAMLLRISANHLNSLWPVVNSEILDALSSVMPQSSQDGLSPDSLLQLCKLIDTLLLLNLDEFQLQEWLFITDTTDAVYRPAHLDPAALTDLLAESFDADPNGLSAAHLPTGNAENGLRKPLLSNAYIRKVRKGEYRDRIFRPFFRQLSIASFEGNYGMEAPDVQACVDDLVEDLFDDETLV